MNDYLNEVSTLRPPLLRIARRHLANPTWAEDAVSETLLAALERPAPQQASLRAWLVSILQHKMVDQIRRNTRELPLDDDDDDSPVQPSAMPPRAAVSAAPPAHADPLYLLERKQVLQQVASCLDRLPERLRRAIVLRDGFGHDTADVCRELGINANNLFVTLHRARNAVRAALAMPQPSGVVPVAAAMLP